MHHSAIMNEKHLLKFIKKKLQTEPNETVIFRDGKYLTLKQVFESLSLSADTLSVDSLDCHADRRTFHRFDRFNLKYDAYVRVNVFLTMYKVQSCWRSSLENDLLKDG